MQTHSRWHRGIKDFIPKRVIGKKHEENAACLRQTYTVDEKTGIARTKYLHATKGWKERIDIGFKRREEPADEFFNIETEEQLKVEAKMTKRKLEAKNG
jgi:hypothetical protein